ncbi:MULTISPECIES: hypothetical protein [Bacillus]|nr:hypothetical protein [Bacillus safensis]WAT81751.1 hypothetical protein O0R49_05185 [Bacillus safensis]
MEKNNVSLQVTNQPELKELLDKAGYQIEQLKQTLSQIESFKPNVKID